MKKLIPLCLLMLMGFSLLAQDAPERYLDEIFSEVQVTSDVIYGENVSILPIVLGQSPTPLPVELKMDVYEPVGDTATNRPLFIIAHAGDYLPAGLNTTPYGDKTDSAFVALAKAMARRGFVGVSMGYRLGWNPLSTIETELRKQVLEASLRATQDMHTCIRWFQKNVAEEGNTFGVNPNMVAIGGEDASTYAATNVAFLKSLSDATIPKFLDFEQSPPAPFIDSTLYGNVYGDVPGLLNIPNHVGYTSDISLVYCLVGGLGEFSWIEAGDPPVVGVQNIHEFNNVGIRSETIGSGANLRILVDAAYSDTIVARSVELGNNDIFTQANFNDPLTEIAKARSGGLPGMLVLNTPIREGEIQCDTTAGVAPDGYGRNGDPWNWYNPQVFQLQVMGFLGESATEAAIRNCRYQTGNPNDAELAKTYIDTIAAYLAPRMVVAMGIQGTSVSIPTSLEDQLARQLKVQAYPNPAQGLLNIKAEAPLRKVELHDLQGRTVYAATGLSHTEFQIDDPSLSAGLYVLRLSFDQGVITEKIHWK